MIAPNDSFGREEEPDRGEGTGQQANIIDHRLIERDELNRQPASNGANARGEILSRISEMESKLSSMTQEELSNLPPNVRDAITAVRDNKGILENSRGVDNLDTAISNVQMALQEIESHQNSKQAEEDYQQGMAMFTSIAAGGSALEFINRHDSAIGEDGHKMHDALVKALGHGDIGWASMFDEKDKEKAYNVQDVGLSALTASTDHGVSQNENGGRGKGGLDPFA